MIRYHCIILLLFASIVGCSSRSSPISDVLAQDATTTDGATSISEVAQRMRAIDLSRCPSDFREAYIGHIHAWEQFALLEADAVQYNENYNSGGAMLESFLRGFMGDPFGKANESVADQRVLQQRYQQCTQQVQVTFQNVELVASRHGVTLPKKESQ